MRKWSYTPKNRVRHEYGSQGTVLYYLLTWRSIVLRTNQHNIPDSDKTGQDKWRASMDNLCSAIKTSLMFRLKEWAITPDDIQNYQVSSWLSPEEIEIFTQKINQAKISRPTLQDLQQNHIPESSDLNLIKAEHTLVDFLEKWFHMAFWEKWLETIYDLLEAHSLEDRDNMPADLQKEYTKYGMTKWIYLSYTLKLQEVLDVHIFQTLIQKYQHNGDTKNYYDCQKYFVKKLLIELCKFPHTRNSSIVKNIVQTKETQCLMKSIIAHTFMKKLWIKHSAISMVGHIALRVYIWDEVYEFDWNDLPPKLVPIMGVNSHSSYDLYFSSAPATFQEWLPEEVLIASTFQNIWLTYNEGKNDEMCIYYIQKALEFFPKLLNCNWRLALHAYEKEDYSNVIKYCLRELEFHQRPDILRFLWSIYQQVSDIPSAIKYYTAFLETNPKDVEVLQLRWLCLLTLSHTKQAAKDFIMLLTLPDSTGNIIAIKYLQAMIYKTYPWDINTMPFPYLYFTVLFSLCNTLDKNDIKDHIWCLLICLKHLYLGSYMSDQDNILIRWRINDISTLLWEEEFNKDKLADIVYNDHINSILALSIDMLKRLDFS